MSKFQNFTYPDREEKAVTIRNPQSALLLVDSRDRYTLNKDGEYDEEIESSPNNILINHQRNLGAGQIKRIAVKEVSIPCATPNVNENNNTLFVKDRLTSKLYYIEVDEDFYSPSELKDWIQNDISQNGWIEYDTGLRNTVWNAPWTVSISPKTNAFTFQSNPAGAPNNWEFIAVPLKGQISDLIDLMNLPQLQYEEDNIITGGVPKMAYTTYIDICSKTLTKYQNLKDSLTQLNYDSILCRVYLNNPLNTPTTDTSYFGARPCINLYRQFENPKYILWNENEMINAIDIQLYDDSGRLLYIPKTNWDLDYYITLELSET